MRALVTGGCGFIGCHLVRLLVEAGDDVVVYDALTDAASGRAVVAGAIGGDRIDIADVCDMPAFCGSLRRWRPDVVYHLAAQSHVDASIAAPLETMRVNAVGTQLVARACAEMGVPLVYCSTDEVYGDAQGAAWERDGAVEDVTLLQPSSPYSAAKAAGEMAVRAAVRTYGLVATITRGSNAWGAYQTPEKLVPIACRLLQRHLPVPLHDLGRPVRQWIAVEDFADGLLHACEDLLAHGICRTVNLAGPIRCSVEALVRAFGAVAMPGSELSTLVTPVQGGRPGQDRSYSVNGDLADRLWKFQPFRSVLDPPEIRRLLDHYGDGEVRLATAGG